MPGQVVVSALHVYPVKSCRGVAVERAEVLPTGLAGDRQFQVVDGDGAPVTQRRHPELATVQPTLVDGGFVLEADGRDPIEITTPTTNDTVATSLLGVPVASADAGDRAAAWFGELLGEPSRLVAMTEASHYRVPFPGMDISLMWADIASVSIANAASLAWLAERAGEEFAIDRFRPNIVVDGAEPWDEDRWREVAIGSNRFGQGFAIPRCAIPQVDQRDGTRHTEPARVLRAHRWCSDAPDIAEPLRSVFAGSALFGLGCSVDVAGSSVSVGDAVTVVTTAEPTIPSPT